MLGDHGLVVGVVHPEFLTEALGVREGESLAIALGTDVVTAESLRPEIERLRRTHTPGDGVDHPVACPAWRRPGVFEEGQIRAGVAPLVGEEQVDRKSV